MRTASSLAWICWAFSYAWGQQPPAGADVPAEIRGCLQAAGAGYAPSWAIHPARLQGDFDGDGKTDYAVLVAKGSQQGIVLCRSGSATPVVLGAGMAFNEMRDLDFTAWHVHPRNRRVRRGAGEGRRPKLSGDAIVLEWESASALVYWSGGRFRWYQQGD
jgi:hypothetical protein